MLIGQKHEIQHHLTETFLKINPDVIGNNYLVFGTVEKKCGVKMSSIQKHRKRY